MYHDANKYQGMSKGRKMKIGERKHKRMKTRKIRERKARISQKNIDDSSHLRESEASATKLVDRSLASTFRRASGSHLSGSSRKLLVSLVYGFTYEGDLAVESGESGKRVRLMKAIENKNLEEISEILQGDIEPWDLMDFSSQTHVLHIAAIFADTSTLDLLFGRPEVNKLVNTQDISGTTPLMTAAWYNNLVAAQYFLDREADTQATMNDTKKTALHCAATLVDDDICRAILKFNKKKFFLDAVDKEGNTALMIAVGAGSASADILFRVGSDYRKKNLITGRNILHQAIVNCNVSMIRMLLDECPEKEFLDAPDNNGETPLMLAIRLEVEDAVKILLQSRHAEMILPRAQLCLHSLVEKGKTKIFVQLLDMIENKSYFNFVDDRGRTVLLYAVELCQLNMLKAMLAVGVNYKIRNYKTGETILHVAAYSNNPAMLHVLLELDEVSDLMEAKDHSGITPCEIILGTSARTVWRKFVTHGLLPYRYSNDSKESSLFIATKKGNYNLVMSILLSEKFNHYYESSLSGIRRADLYELELQNIIYTSDLYLLLGISVGKRKWQLCPEQEDLFLYNETEQNIFHACALGENLDCLVLIYEYCQRYNKKHITDLDRPDVYGNTPLVFALRRGCRSICKFFMKKGADLSVKNNSNQTALEVMIDDFPNFQSLLLEVINECVTFDNNVIKKSNQYSEMKIVYDNFCPPGKKQMAVLEHMFHSLKGRSNIAIIQSPVLEYFIMCKWCRIQKIIEFRFFMYAFLVVLFSTYLTFFLSTFLIMDPLILAVLGVTISVLSVIMILFSVPLMFFINKEPLPLLIIIAAPILILIFVQMEPNTRLALEVGAAGVLFGWFAILIIGSVSRLSFQVAMFFEVVRKVSCYIPMCLIMLYAFSHCFFILFHDFFPFNNPLHAFITTSVLLIHSENGLPVFNQNLSPLNNKPNIYKVFDEETGKIDGKAELRGMVVEGSILLLFDVLFNFCFLNMLVGLGVRSGEELVSVGHMMKAKRYVKEIFTWEMFVDSRFYKISEKLKLLWLMGVPRDLKEKLTIPTVHMPLSQCCIPDLVQKLRQVARSVHRIPEVSIPFAAEILLKK